MVCVHFNVISHKSFPSIITTQAGVYALSNASFHLPLSKTIVILEVILDIYQLSHYLSQNDSRFLWLHNYQPSISSQNLSPFPHWCLYCSANYSNLNWTYSIVISFRILIKQIAKFIQRWGVFRVFRGFRVFGVFRVFRFFRVFRVFRVFRPSMHRSGWSHCPAKHTQLRAGKNYLPFLFVVNETNK